MKPPARIKAKKDGKCQCVSCLRDRGLTPKGGTTLRRPPKPTASTPSIDDAAELERAAAELGIDLSGVRAA